MHRTSTNIGRRIESPIKKSGDQNVDDYDTTQNNGSRFKMHSMAADSEQSDYFTKKGTKMGSPLKNDYEEDEHKVVLESSYHNSSQMQSVVHVS